MRKHRIFLLIFAWFLGLGLTGLVALPGNAEDDQLTGFPTDPINSEHELVLVFDVSASIDVYGNFIDRGVISDVMKNLNGTWRVGVIVFGSEVSRVVELKAPDQWKAEDYQRVNIARSQVEKGTNFSTSLKMAVDMLGGGSPNADIDRRIVLVTDANFETGERVETEEQRAAVQVLIEDEIRASGIRLIVIDANKSKLPEPCSTENDRCLWRNLAYQTDKGDYFRIDGRGDYLSTLSFASYTSGESRYHTDRTVEIPVLPYREILEFETWVIQPSVTVTLQGPDDRVYPPKSSTSNGYWYEIPYPRPGNWRVTFEVGPEGVYDLTDLERILSVDNPFPARQLTLRQEEYNPRLPQGHPLVVRFSIRDQDNPGAALGDHFEFSARLTQSSTQRVRSVHVRPVNRSNYQGYYEARIEDTDDLLGDHQLEIEGVAKGASDVYISQNWPVFFGETPQFSGPPVVKDSDPRVELPFSVTIRIANRDLVDLPYINLHFQGEDLDEYLPMRCSISPCILELPAISSPGDYRLTAILESGQTVEGVTYPQMTSETITFHIRKLTFVERNPGLVVLGKTVGMVIVVLLGLVSLMWFGIPAAIQLMIRIFNGWQMTPEMRSRKVR